MTGRPKELVSPAVYFDAYLNAEWEISNVPPCPTSHVKMFRWRSSRSIE